MFQNFIFYPPTGSRRRVGDFRGEGAGVECGGKSPTIGANTSRAGDDVGVKWITPRHLMVVGRQSSSRPESVLHKKALATMVTPTTLTLVNLNSCPNRYFSRQRLRSAQQNTLVVPRYRLTTYGRRAFSGAGPTAWNSLPVAFRDRQSAMPASDGI